MPGKLGLLGCVGRGNLEAEDLFGHGEIGGPLLGVGEVDPVAAGDLEAEEGGEEAVVFAVDGGGGGGAEGVAVELALDGGAGDRFSPAQERFVGVVGAALDFDVAGLGLGLGGRGCDRASQPHPENNAHPHQNRADPMHRT